MNLELYGYALGETLASGDEPSLPEPEPPQEHAPDCRCYQCQHDPFFRGISEAIRAHVLVTEVAEAARQESALESYRNPSTYAGSRASSAQGKAIGKRVGSRPATEPTGDILTPEQLADRLQVGVRWVYEQTRNREGMRDPDPLPFRKMGKYLRFYWPEVREWLDRQSKRVKKGGVHCETTNRMHRARR